MPVPTNKEQLIHAISSDYEKLVKDLITIPKNLTKIKNLDGHSKNTFISVENLIAYLIGWGQLVLKWHSKKLNDEIVDFPETGYKWNELGLLAQKFYKDYEALSYEVLLSELDKTVKQILSLIDKHTDGELYQTAWYDTWTLGRLIQLNTSSPYKNARNRIRKWKKQEKIESLKP